MELKPHPKHPNTRSLVTVENPEEMDLMANLAPLRHPVLAMYGWAVFEDPRDLSVSNRKLWGLVFREAVTAQSARDAIDGIIEGTGTADTNLNDLHKTAERAQAICSIIHDHLVEVMDIVPLAKQQLQ